MGQTTFSGPVSSQNGFTAGSFTTAQRNALTNVATGTLIFNTTTNQAEVYNGTAWIAAFAPPAPVGTTYSAANGDWVAGQNGFTGVGVSWGGGYDKEIDYSNSISPAAFAAFNALTIGQTIIISTGGVDYPTTVTATTVAGGSMSWLNVAASSPLGYTAPAIVDAITIV